MTTLSEIRERVESRRKAGCRKHILDDSEIDSLFAMIEEKDAALQEIARGKMPEDMYDYRIMAARLSGIARRAIGHAKAVGGPSKAYLQGQNDRDWES